CPDEIHLLRGPLTNRKNAYQIDDVRFPLQNGESRLAVTGGCKRETQSVDDVGDAEVVDTQLSFWDRHRRARVLEPMRPHDEDAVIPRVGHTDAIYRAAPLKSVRIANGFCTRVEHGRRQQGQREPDYANKSTHGSSL